MFFVLYSFICSFVIKVTSVFNFYGCVRVCVCVCASACVYVCVCMCVCAALLPSAVFPDQYHNIHTPTQPFTLSASGGGQTQGGLAPVSPHPQASPPPGTPVINLLFFRSLCSRKTQVKLPLFTFISYSRSPSTWSLCKSALFPESPPRRESICCRRQMGGGEK